MKTSHPSILPPRSKKVGLTALEAELLEELEGLKNHHYPDGISLGGTQEDMDSQIHLIKANQAIIKAKEHSK